MPKPYKTPLERKLKYVENLASDEGVELSMLRWESRLDEIMINISFNVIFNFLLDLHLDLDLHFELPDLDFKLILPEDYDFLIDVGYNVPEIVDMDVIDKYNIEIPNYGDYFVDIDTGFTFNIIEKIDKAKYGKSKYGMAIYDPERVGSKPLKRLLWELRYKTTDKDGATIKLTGEALKKWVDQLKEYLTQREVEDYYQDVMMEILALVEGKMASVSYWDFAAFDVSVFSEKDTFKSRFTDDWRTEKELETTGIYDVHFDFCRFDYARFSDSYEHGTISVKKELGDILQKRIDWFHKRSGIVEQYGHKTIYQRVFFHQKEDKMHWKGGHHQITLQNIKNHIKQMLNQEGVIAQFKI